MLRNERTHRVVEELKAAHAGISKGRRSKMSTQALWLAVEIGNGRAAASSHEDGAKRVATDVLPDASHGPKGKAREYRRNFERATRSQRWMEGYNDCSQEPKMPIKIVNHNKEFRAADSTHTHDAENEVSRFKLWSRENGAK